MKILILDGFDFDFVEKVPFLRKLRNETIFAKVRCFPNVDLINVIKNLNKPVEVIHKTEIDKLAHNNPELLKQYFSHLNKWLGKNMTDKEFIICSDHGNKELSEADKALTGLNYGHDYFITYTPFFYYSKKQSPKDLGEITGKEMLNFLKMVCEK